MSASPGQLKNMLSPDLKEDADPVAGGWDLNLEMILDKATREAAPEN
jgi:hypothetical protein